MEVEGFAFALDVFGEVSEQRPWIREREDRRAAFARLPSCFGWSHDHWLTSTEGASMTVCGMAPTLVRQLRGPHLRTWP